MHKLEVTILIPPEKESFKLNLTSSRSEETSNSIIYYLDKPRVLNLSRYIFKHVVQIITKNQEELGTVEINQSQIEIVSWRVRKNDNNSL